MIILAIIAGIVGVAAIGGAVAAAVSPRHWPEADPPPRRARPAPPRRANTGGFAAIDFETASGSYASACSLGLVVFRNGEPSDRRHWLIDPGCGFDPENIAIHGITPGMVRDAPGFADIWPEIEPLFRSLPIVAWSPFDARVLDALADRHGLPAPLATDYVDACAVARSAIIGLTNYRLPTAARFLGIPLDHHNALSDAEACGRIYARILAEPGGQIVACWGTPASRAQQDYITDLGGTIPPVLTRSDASKMIDALIERRLLDKEAEAARRKHIRDRDREEGELRRILAAMTDPGYKPVKPRSKRLRDLREFQRLIARIISDDAIEAREIADAMSWLEANRVLPDDFSAALETLGEARRRMESGEDCSSLAGDVYARLLDCCIELRDRPNI